MTGKELKKAENNEIIREAISTYGLLLRGYAINRGTQKLEKHFYDCCYELVIRGLVTQDDVDFLNR